jgi:galactose-1-phosphate uridylyltransferase
MSLAEVYAVLLLWTRRYRQLCDSGEVPFAMIFKNNGFEAGATQQRVHHPCPCPWRVARVLAAPFLRS